MELSFESQRPLIPGVRKFKLTPRIVYQIYFFCIGLSLLIISSVSFTGMADSIKQYEQVIRNWKNEEIISDIIFGFECPNPIHLQGQPQCLCETTIYQAPCSEQQAASNCKETIQDIPFCGKSTRLYGFSDECRNPVKSCGKLDDMDLCALDSDVCPVYSIELEQSKFKNEQQNTQLLRVQRYGDQQIDINNSTPRMNFFISPKRMICRGMLFRQVVEQKNTIQNILLYQIALIGVSSGVFIVVACVFAALCMVQSFGDRFPKIMSLLEQSYWSLGGEVTIKLLVQCCQGFILYITFCKVLHEMENLDLILEQNCSDKLTERLINHTKGEIHDQLFIYNLAYLLIFLVSLLVDGLVLMRIAIEQCMKKKKKSTKKVSNDFTSTAEASLITID